MKISQWVLNFGAQTLMWPPVSSPHPHFMLLLLAESHGGRLGNPAGSALDLDRRMDRRLAGEYCAYVIQRQAFLECLLWVLGRVLLMVQWCEPSPPFLPSWNLQPSEDCKSNNHEVTAGRDTGVISMKREHEVPREPMTEGTLRS